MNPPDNLKWRVGFFPIDHAKTPPSYLDWTFEDREEAQRHAETMTRFYPEAHFFVDLNPKWSKNVSA